ncbi:MAG TPA: hypothetical protein VMH81_03370 [Bryobacteraceae bacterium]|nr:hypothetical protein [Bryobacteraceae bacterium]
MKPAGLRARHVQRGSKVSAGAAEVAGLAPFQECLIGELALEGKAQAAHHPVLAEAAPAGTPQMNQKCDVGDRQQCENRAVHEVHVYISSLAVIQS